MIDRPDLIICLTHAIRSGRLKVFPHLDPRRTDALAQYLARQIIHQLPGLFREDEIEVERENSK